MTRAKSESGSHMSFILLICAAAIMFLGIIYVAGIDHRGMSGVTSSSGRIADADSIQTAGPSQQAGGMEAVTGVYEVKPRKPGALKDADNNRIHQYVIS